MIFTYRRTYSIILFFGAILGFPLGLGIENPYLRYGFILANVVFWAWFGERILRTDDRLARLDEDIETEVKAKVRLESLGPPRVLENPGPAKKPLGVFGAGYEKAGAEK